MSEGAPASSQYVVVGAGLAGAATAWRLAAAGHEVIVLERTTPANALGSSHGSARIFRYAYPDPFWVDLVIAARREWDELEAAIGAQLITPTGAVDGGDRRDPVGLARVLSAAGLENDLFSERDARGRWPGIRWPGQVLWQPDAGVIDAERSVQAMLSLAERAGAGVLTEWDVIAAERTATGYRLTSATGSTMDAENVVVAAGGWLPALLGELDLPPEFLAAMPTITVMQEQAFHFPYRDGRDWPTFIHKSDAIQVYGLPGGRDAEFRGQKVAEYNGGRAIRSAHDNDGVVDAAKRTRVVEFVRHSLPGLEPEPYAETTCLFTNTPDEEFIVDRVDGITIVSPCSGHGAKFAPLIGSLAAELAASAAPDDSRVPRRFRPVVST